MKNKILLLSFLALLCGCSAQNELDELLILTGIGIDESEDGNVTVIFRTVNPSGSKSGMEGGDPSQSPNYTFTSEGKDIIEAFSNISSILGRQPFYSHVKALVVGEQFARNQGLEDVINFMERHDQLRDSYLLFVAKESSAESIMNVFTPIENSSVFTLTSMFYIPGGANTMQEGIKLEDFIKWVYGDDRAGVAMGVEKVSTHPSSNLDTLKNIDGNLNAIRLTSLGIFDKSRLKEWLSVKDMRTYSILTDTASSPAPYTVACPEEEGTISFLLKERDINAEPELKNGKLLFRVELKGSAILDGLTCSSPLSNQKGASSLENWINESMKNDLIEALENAKQTNLDYFGIKNHLFRNDTKQWEQLKDDWEQLYADMEIKTDIHIYMESPGARVENNED
ncbi:Ger(x)C family spore germination protein [Halobacillus litoralis]|uniref:Ger(x)C family spore germination protein n=1 Tax=Halobacillus litoralis TaxID=45668 RepID=UPI001CD68C27|nr:Ger(x)C family spore germination protein [Halobacillus litoralis]MCA1021087.1 Ger(x)C family spore germination protein [Halobacillus litoralis]